MTFLEIFKSLFFVCMITQKKINPVVQLIEFDNPPCKFGQIIIDCVIFHAVSLYVFLVN